MEQWKLNDLRIKAQMIAQRERLTSFLLTEDNVVLCGAAEPSLDIFRGSRLYNERVKVAEFFSSGKCVLVRTSYLGEVVTGAILASLWWPAATYVFELELEGNKKVLFSINNGTVESLVY